MNAIDRYRVIEVKYIGPSNTRGSRIKLIDTWRGESVTMSVDYEYNRSSDQAIAWLNNHGFNVVADSANQITKTDYIMIADFSKSIKEVK